MQNLLSLFGFFVFVFISYLMCRDRKHISWRPVLIGIILQFVFAFFVFTLPWSRALFLALSEIFTKILFCSRDGITFVFGSLGASPCPVGPNLAFQVLPFIIIFSALMGLLYYLKIIPWVIKNIARFLSGTLKTSGAESLCAASNIFVGVESATAIRPYLAGMSESELFTIMVVGMATVASSVLAVYVSFLSGVFPAIAGHLISASFISVPAAFVVSKLMVPETGIPETADFRDCHMHDSEKVNGMSEAIISGASAGAKLALGVAVTLIAFIGLLGILRGALDFLTGRPDFLQDILSYIFYPFSYLMGVNSLDVPVVSKMLGTRLILTEIPAYQQLAVFAAAGGNPRSVLIASYALCGFAHVASVAIFAGGIGILVPEKRAVLARLGFRALIAATLVTLMTGAVAGVFYWGQAGVLQ